MLGNMISHNMSLTPKGKMFLIFGFDILIDQDLKAWVLEINDHPSFNIHYTNQYIGSAPSNETLSQVDLLVKR